MTLRFRILLIPALALAGCSSLFGGGEHPRPKKHEPEWHPPREMLLQYDTNHDGILTRAELEAGLKADFAKADTNHDGRLDEAEVRAVNVQRWTADSSAASPLVDWNHDGTVDLNEFSATARSLFDQMDTDGDGKLSKEELNPPEQPVEKRKRGARGQEQGDGDPDGE